MVDEVAEHFGRIDVPVNNAGVSGANQPTHEIAETEWDWIHGINVKGFCVKRRKQDRCVASGAQKSG